MQCRKISYTTFKIKNKNKKWDIFVCFLICFFFNRPLTYIVVSSNGTSSMSQSKLTEMSRNKLSGLSSVTSALCCSVSYICAISMRYQDTIIMMQDKHSYVCLYCVANVINTGYKMFKSTWMKCTCINSIFLRQKWTC